MPRDLGPLNIWALAFEWSKLKYTLSNIFGWYSAFYVQVYGTEWDQAVLASCVCLKKNLSFL